MNKNYLALAVFAVLIAVFYGNTLLNGFVFDDFLAIVHNSYIHSWEYLPKVVTGCIAEITYGGCEQIPYAYYRPIQSLSLLLTYQISSQPWIFHLTNLLLFFTAVSLVFVFTKLLTARFLTAFIAALIFLSHPLNSSVVNFASAATDLLLAIFSMLTLIFYITYRHANSLRDFLLIYVFYFLAILSKEPAILLPLIAVAIDLLFFQMGIRQLFQRETLKRYLFFGIPIIIYVFLKTAIMGSLSVGRVAEFTWIEGIQMRIILFAQYLSRLFYPYPLSLHHLTERGGELWNGVFFMALASVFLFFVIFFFLFKKQINIPSFSFIWFLVFFVPIIVFLVGEPDYMLVDRYLLLPSIGFSLLVAYIFSYFFRYARRTQYVLLLVFIVLLVSSWLYVFPQNKNWKNTSTMSNQILRHYPDAHLFRFDRAIALAKEQGDFAGARKEFEEIVARNPNWKDIDKVYEYIGDVYKMEGNTETALGFYRKAVEVSGGTQFSALADIGIIYREQKNYLQAFSYFCRSLQLFPTESTQKNFEAIVSLIDSNYIQQGILYKTILDEFEKYQIENISFRSKKCDEESCQYSFTFQIDSSEVLPSFLITAAVVSDGADIEIQNRSFEQEQSIITLQIHSRHEDDTISFLFPRCAATYYEITNDQ